MSWTVRGQPVRRPVAVAWIGVWATAGEMPRMALAAGLRQVVCVYGRARVRGRQDQVRLVAGGAVGHGPVSGPALEAVVRVHERLQTPRGQVVLLVEGRRLVAGGAGGLGHPGRAHGRAWVAGGQDAVFAVAVGAGGGVHLAALHHLAVDASPVLPLDDAVAVPAGPRDVEEVDGRFGATRRQDAVGRAPGGVAVVAGGGRCPCPPAVALPCTPSW